MGDAHGKDGRPGAEAAPTIDALSEALERERARAREVEHRTKNTLQLVSSLVLLLSRRSRDEETRRVLRSLHQRVSAVAAVHRRGPEAAEVEGFDLAGFVREQVTALARSAPEGVTVRLDLQPERVAERQAVALALIVNELTANALTHAAAPNRETVVTVGLDRQGEALVLSVEDNGPGLPAEAEERGFGLTMVRLLAQQLGAALALENAQPGLRALVTLA